MSVSEPPSHVFLDSSLIAAKVFPGSAHSVAASTFFDHLFASDSTAYVSELVKFEYGQVLRNLAVHRNRLPSHVREQFGLDRWNDDLFVRARWLAHGDAGLKALIDQFAVFYEVPVRREFWDRMLSMMTYYDLKSYDAVHLATIQHYGIPHFATCDRHFAAVDGLSLFLMRDSSAWHMTTETIHSWSVNCTGLQRC